MNFIKKHRKLIILFVILLIIISIFIYKKINNNKELERTGGTNNQISTQRNHEYKLYCFGLENCDACKIMEPIYQQATKDYLEKLDFEYADVTEKVDLSNKYVINVVPTFIIVDSNGTVIRREIGVMSKDDFYSFIDSVINR